MVVTLTARVAALPLTAYATGQVFTFIPDQTNSGAVTLNIDGLGAKDVFSNNAVLTGLELPVNVPVSVRYDGTRFQVLGVTVAQMGSSIQVNRNAVQLSVQVGAYTLLTSVLGTNTITASIAGLPLGAYPIGGVFRFLPSQQNTGSATLNVDGVLARTLVINNTVLQGGELRTDQYAEVLYNGTNFELLNKGPLALSSTQITGTASLIPVTPAVQQRHESAVKAWGTANSAGTIIQAYPSSASGARDSLGIFTITHGANFNSTNYPVIVTSVTNNYTPAITGKTATTFTVQFVDILGALVDPTAFSYMAAGRLT